MEHRRCVRFISWITGYRVRAESDWAPGTEPREAEPAADQSDPTPAQHQTQRQRTEAASSDSDSGISHIANSALHLRAAAQANLASAGYPGIASYAHHMGSDVRQPPLQHTNASGHGFLFPPTLTLTYTHTIRVSQPASGDDNVSASELPVLTGKTDDITDTQCPRLSGATMHDAWPRSSQFPHLILQQ